MKQQKKEQSSKLPHSSNAEAHPTGWLVHPAADPPQAKATMRFRAHSHTTSHVPSLGLACYPRSVIGASASFARREVVRAGPC